MLFVSQVLVVAHTYNPCYLGGRDEEDCSLRPAWENSLWDTILKIPSIKKELAEWLKCYSLSRKPCVQILVPQRMSFVLLVLYLRNHCLIQGHRGLSFCILYRFILLYSSMSFMEFSLIFRSLVHWESIFLYDMGKGPTSLFSLWTS
jgi:hypothetical protein